MSTTSVFSNVRADLSSDFVNKFPEYFDFNGMLQQICNETGIKVLSSSDIKYILHGHWGPMGRVHDHLANTLAVYCASANNTQCQEVLSDHNFGISLLYSASQYANESTSQQSNSTVSEVKSKSDIASIGQNPTSSCDSFDNDKSHCRSNCTNSEHSDGDTENDETVDDRDTDDSNAEYSQLKSEISSICSSLKLNEDDMNKSFNESKQTYCKDVIEKYDNYTIKKFDVVEKSYEKNKETIKRGRGRPRKYPLKEQKSEASLNINRKSTDVGSLPKKSLYRTQRQKIQNKYKNGLKWKTSKLKTKPNSYFEGNLVKRKRGRPRKDPDEQADFPCPNCDFIARTRNQLGDHRHRIHLATPTKCDVCNKIFPNARYMRRHRSSHVQPQHCCDICGKMYKILKALRDHRKTHEIGYTKPEFPCDLCSKSFCTRYILECHCKSEHLGQRKSFLCSICGKSFTTKHTLIQHSNVHTGSRPYGCDLCGKSFAYESALRDHKFIHSQDKIFNCEICQKSFRQRSALKMHEKIHKEKKDFTCRECGRGFTQKQALQRHERAHKGDKPFYCKLCGRTFGDASIIRRHMILVHKIHKDSKTWREDIVARGKAVQSRPILLDQGHDINKKHTDDNDDSLDSIESTESHKDFHDTEEGQSGNLPISSSLPVTVDTATTPVSAAHSMTLAQTSQPSQTHTNAHISNMYDMDSSSPMDYHLSPDSVDVSSRYNYASPTQQQSSTENNTTESRYQTTTQVLPHTRLPRVDSVLSKRLNEMEPPENLSISSLYTYYTNLASQYINVSQYQNYVPTPDGHPSTNQH